MASNFDNIVNRPYRTEAQARADIARDRGEIECPDCLGSGREKYEPFDPSRRVEWRECERCQGNRTITEAEKEE